MKKYLLLALVLVLIVTFAVLKSTGIYAASWWGCSFSPLNVSPQSSYYIGYEHSNGLTDFSVGTGHENPTYYVKNQNTNAWEGPYKWWGPKIRFLSSGVLVEGINENEGVESDWTQAQNMENAYLWQPKTEFALDGVNFFGSDPGVGVIKIYENEGQPGKLVRQCQANSLPSYPAPAVNAGSDIITQSGQNIQFNGFFTSQDQNPTVKWDFGDGSFSEGDLHPWRVFFTPGVYQVKLIVTDHLNQTGEDNLSVKVDPVLAQVEILPGKINLKNSDRNIMFKLVLPPNLSGQNIEVDTVFIFNSIAPVSISPGGDNNISFWAKFNLDTFSENLVMGENQIPVSGKLKNGIFFEGKGTIEVSNNPLIQNLQKK